MPPIDQLRKRQHRQERGAIVRMWRAQRTPRQQTRFADLTYRFSFVGLHQLAHLAVPAARRNRGAGGEPGLVLVRRSGEAPGAGDRRLSSLEHRLAALSKSALGLFGVFALQDALQLRPQRLQGRVFAADRLMRRGERRAHTEWRIGSDLVG